MDTHTGGGFFAGLARSFGGGSFFITDFTARGPGHVAFAPRFSGTIIPALLQSGQSLICRKETFFVAEKSVALEIAWQRRIGAGFFGGGGFILQKVTGPDVVWLDLSGKLVERDLGAGERLLAPAPCRHVRAERRLRHPDGQRFSQHSVRRRRPVSRHALPALGTSGFRACQSSISPRKPAGTCRSAATRARTSPRARSGRRRRWARRRHSRRVARRLR
jgi:hypothetical protein